MKNIILSTVMFGVLCAIARGHPGGLDAHGGHNDRRTGGYHYHSGAPSPAPPPVPLAIPEPRVMARTTSRLQPRTEARTVDRRTELSHQFKIQNQSPFANLTEDEKNEKLAEAKLKIAKQFLDQRKFEIARKWLNECVSLYPGTVAAAEAKELLVKHEYSR